MNSHAASFFFEPAGMARPWLLEPGKLPAGPGRHQPVAHRLLHRAFGVLGERHHPGDRLGADVGAARHLRAHRLVVGIGEQAVRPVFHQKVGVPFARLGGLRRVERRRQVVRRRLEHAAAHAHQVGNPVPVMQLVGGEGGHAVLVVDRVADLDQLVEGRGHAEARLLDQVVARRALDHGAAFPGEAEGLALGVLHRRLRAGHEILRRPVGRRRLGILGEGVEAGEPAGADPAAGIDEGDVDHVERRALGRQFEVGALVVDREGLHGEAHLDAGLLLELREVVLAGIRSRSSGSTTR